MKRTFHPSLVRYAPHCLLLGVLLVIACSFYLSLTLYSYFIIGRDEANFLLRSSMLIFSSRDIHEQWQQLFQTHGQHVLLGMQLANLVSISIFGVIDFQFINFIGLLYLVVPGWVILRRFITTHHQRFAIISIAAAIIFPLALSPGHLGCAINTACSGNHYLGLGLSILSLHLFVGLPKNHTSTLRLLSAECVAALAILSSPAALALVGVLLIPAWLHPLRTKALLIHIAASLLILKLYFTIALPADFNYLADSGPLEWLKLLALFVLFCLQLLGSVFFWPGSFIGSVVCVLLGVLVLGASLYLLWRRLRILPHDSSQLFFACGLLLLLGMVALIGLGRIGTAGSNRYIFYACFALIFLLCLWLGSAEVSPRKLWIVALLCLASYPLQLGLNAPYIDRIRGEIDACNERWQRERQACGVMMKHTDATELLLEAERQGILRLPRPGL